MAQLTIIGKRVPAVELGRLSFGQVERVQFEQLLSGRRALIIGVPGAFTPVCTREHLPDFIRQSEVLRARGYDLLICIAANDPFTVEAWAEDLDPERKISFLSDGNLDLARELGAIARAPELFLGQRSARYLMTTENAVVTRFVVEREPLALTCTRVGEVLLDPPRPEPQRARASVA